MNTAVITGAGSGVGRALARMLWQAGWRVAILGRHEETLRETASVAPEGSALVIPCDVGDLDQVKAMGKRVLDTWGQVDALINSAGTNTPRRSLAELSEADYRYLVAANMDGAYWCVQQFLPGMRARGRGSIVNIASIAGIRASPLAGVAYVMAKFGMVGLTQSINAEERANGIRACSICPGDINTPILDRRPNPPPAAARVNMLQSEDVAACAMLALTLPDRAVIEHLVIAPR